MNIVLLFCEIAFVFSSVLLFKKLFGEHGLTAWVCIATIAANILTAKSGEMFGLSVALGTVMFASTFLSTDILSELYGEYAARRAVALGLAATIIFTIAAQITLRYTPTSFDYADGPMHVLFGLNLRISISSAVMYYIANTADVWLYNKMKERSNGRNMWIRNNVATALCNGLENFAFIFLAFIGIYSAKECFAMALSTTIIECFVAACDTPFLYIATRSRKNVNEAIPAGAGK